MFAAIADTHALARVILYSLVVAVGVTGVFSFGIVGLTRFDEIRRGTRRGPAFVWAGVALVAALVVAAVVVEAIVVMAKK
jgi:4-amino-4-deoxy-L-arabinose transferase-like glycosyltransferase